MVNTKCFIFDQDDTLYSSANPLAHELRRKTKKWISRRLNLADGQLDAFYEILKREYPNPFLGLQSVGVTVAEYHSEVFDLTDVDEYISADPVLVELFESITSPKYIVTFASRPYSELLQQRLGIKGYIQDTLYVKDYAPSYSKRICYEEIGQALGLKPEELSVIGDNFVLDVLPGLEMGCAGIHISECPGTDEYVSLPSIYDLARLLAEGG